MMGCLAVSLMNYRHNTIQYEVGDVARDLDDGLLGRLTHELQTQYNTIRGWGRGTRP